MPNGWTKVGTPEELEALLNDPPAFAIKADELVEEAGGVLGHIFWEKFGGPAYILSHVPAANADAVFARLDENIGPTTPILSTEEVVRRHNTSQTD